MSFKFFVQYLFIFLLSAAGVFYYSLSSSTLQAQTLMTQILSEGVQRLNELITARVYIDYAFFTLAVLTLFMIVFHLLSYMRNKRKHVKHLQKIDQLYTLISKTSHLSKDIHDAQYIYKKACEDIVKVAGFDFAWIGKYSPNSRSIEPISSFGNGPYLDDSFHGTAPKRVSSSAKAYLQNKTVVNNDLSKDKTENSTLALKNSLKSNTSLLIKLGTGVESILTVYSNSTDCFDHQMIILLQKVCDDISHALESIHAETTEERYLDELRVAAAAFDTQEAMIITDTQHKIIKVNKAFCRLTGYSEDEILGKQPNLIQSGEHDKLFYTKLYENLSEHGTWKGELINKRKNGELFTVIASISAIKDFGDEITHYIEQAIDISDQKKTQEQITKQAFHDTLTGLANRTLLLDRLNYSLLLKKRNRSFGSLFFIDMDNFKNINDSYGHDVGDLLLIEVAQRLLKSVREEDTICRIGGDEFVVLIEDLGTDKNEAVLKAEKIAEHVLNKLSMTYHCKNIELFSSPSIGITLFPDLSSDSEEILNQADISMYVAKKGGKNSLYFYNEELDLKLKKQKDIERSLREALLHNEFELFFQPKLSIDTQSLTGIASFIYWHHPTKGILKPDDFLEIAVSNNFIIPLEEWALRAACEQIKEYEKIMKKDQTITVHISEMHFNQRAFVHSLKETIDETKINPSHLEIELSESIMVKNSHEAIIKINELKDLGIKFSLNNFGIGSSSLYHLKELPVKEFKIDKSFTDDIIQDENASAVVETIIKLAHTLDLKVISEGINTEEQLGMLRELHCDIYQGDISAKPLTGKEFKQILSKSMNGNWS